MLASGQWRIAWGEFDPVNAAVAERLQALKTPEHKLLVVVKPSTEEFLFDQQARAVLLAALRSVDAVIVETDSNWRTLARENANWDVREDTEFDNKARMSFESLVMRRHRAERS